MKKCFTIPVLLLAFILFSAKRCDDNAGENRLMEQEALGNTMDSIKKEFEADFLNEASLFAFQEKARQKLMDYADYINIANDTSLDSAFRSQAAAMAHDLFLSQNLTVISSHWPIEITIDSILVIKPLQRSADGGYRGILGFRLKVREFVVDDTLIARPSWKMIDMVATKTSSLFGKDTRMIWKVFLGEMKAAPGIRTG